MSERVVIDLTAYEHALQAGQLMSRVARGVTRTPEDAAEAQAHALTAIALVLTGLPEFDRILDMIGDRAEMTIDHVRKYR